MNKKDTKSQEILGEGAIRESSQVIAEMSRKAEAEAEVKAKNPDVEAMEILTKLSLKVYTVGGNQVYNFLKHARAHIRKHTKAPKAKPSTEDLNTAFASIFA